VILLDTNVLSELMRPRPDPGVLKWFDHQPAASLWISAITRAEIELGIALLPSGKRRQALADAADVMFREDFNGRCLPFDGQAAGHYAVIVAQRTLLGKPITVEDAQIAAIARSNELTLATRNVKDFAGIEDLVIVNPWKQEE
jgi:predicted nucleic acid-binding protein